MIAPTAMMNALAEPTSGHGLGWNEMVVVIRFGMGVSHVVFPVRSDLWPLRPYRSEASFVSDAIALVRARRRNGQGQGRIRGGSSGV